MRRNKNTVQLPEYKHVYQSSREEFSKVIVRRSMWLFSVQVALSLLVIFFKPDSGSQVVGLTSVTIPLYAVIFGGYFGKAGLENYQKIKNEGEEECATEEYPSRNSSNG